MDQIAGHITNYHNLRSVADTDGEIDTRWTEVYYYLENGAIERARRSWLRFVPTYFTGNARGSIELRKGLKHDYDAMFSNASVAMLFPRSFGRTPTLYDFDSTPLQLDRMDEYTAKPDPKPVATLKFKVAKRFMHSVALLQAWTRWAAQSAIDDYGVSADRVVVNPPGVDLRQWRPHDRSGHGPRVRVLFVGGDFHRKGGDLLLDWRSRRPGDDLELHLVTGEKIDPRPGVVVHHDLKPNSPELLALYAQADIFVLPSRAECFGIATIEAMASGLPVISTDVGGTADIIEPERNGYIAKGGDHSSLEAVLDKLVDDRDLRLRMGTESRALAEERFDLTVNAERTLRFLKELASGERPR